MKYDRHTHCLHTLSWFWESYDPRTYIEVPLSLHGRRQTIPAAGRLCDYFVVVKFIFSTRSFRALLYVSVKVLFQTYVDG